VSPMPAQDAGADGLAPVENLKEPGDRNQCGGDCGSRRPSFVIIAARRPGREEEKRRVP